MACTKRRVGESLAEQRASDGTAAEFIAIHSGFGTLQTIAGYIDTSPNLKVWTQHSTVAGAPWRTTTLELSTTATTEFYRVSETKQ